MDADIYIINDVIIDRNGGAAAVPEPGDGQPAARGGRARRALPCGWTSPGGKQMRKMGVESRCGK